MIAAFVLCYFLSDSLNQINVLQSPLACIGTKKQSFHILKMSFTHSLSYTKDTVWLPANHDDVKNISIMSHRTSMLPHDCNVVGAAPSFSPLLSRLPDAAVVEE